MPTSTINSDLSVLGTISQTLVTNSLVKADGVGKLIPAVAGVDYLSGIPNLQQVATVGNTYTGDLILNSVTVGAGLGEENTILGKGALAAATITSKWNIAIGPSAMAAHISGYNNTAIGEFAMATYVGDSTIANNNVAIGNSVMYNATAGVRNTIVGTAAGVLGSLRSRGNDNLFLGMYAGRYQADTLTTPMGDRNILIGLRAGEDQLIGSDSLRIGNKNSDGTHIIEGYMGTNPTLDIYSSVTVRDIGLYTYQGNRGGINIDRILNTPGQDFWGFNEFTKLSTNYNAGGYAAFNAGTTIQDNVSTNHYVGFQGYPGFRDNADVAYIEGASVGAYFWDAAQIGDWYGYLAEYPFIMPSATGGVQNNSFAFKVGRSRGATPYDGSVKYGFYSDQDWVINLFQGTTTLGTDVFMPGLGAATGSYQALVSDNTTGKLMKIAVGSGSVSSINVAGSGALTFSGGPITTSGTISAGWSGSNTQYVRGDGTLATFPSATVVNDATLTLATSGIATGSQTFTANSATNKTFTVNVPSTLSSYTNDAGFTTNTGTVTSVASTMGGNALNVTGSPITTSGTLAYAWQGTAGQYVNGLGNLVTFPTLTSGTVTSVGLTMPTGFTVSNSPVTSSGTLAVTTTLNGNLRGNGTGFVVGNVNAATELTGITPVANGGIGVGTITGVMIGNGTSAVTGVTGTASQYLRRNAANTAYEFATFPTIPTVNNGTLTMAVAGGILSGSASFTANQAGNTTFTVTSPGYGTTAGTIAQGNDSRFHNPVTIGTANGLSLSTQVLSLGLASTSTTGALSSTDWNAFANKISFYNYLGNGFGANLNTYPRHGIMYTYAGSSNAPNGNNGMTINMGIATADPITAQIHVDATADDGLYFRRGYELGGTWYHAASRSWVSSQLHNPVTIGTANGLTLSTQALSLGLASTSTNGALSSTDWNTFNNKLGSIPNLNQVTAVGNYSDANIEIGSNHGVKLGIGSSTGWAARNIITSGYSTYDYVRLTSPGFTSATGYFEVDKQGSTVATGNSKVGGLAGTGVRPVGAAADGTLEIMTGLGDNFANANLTLTGNRAHQVGTHNLSIVASAAGFSQIFMNSLGVKIASSGGVFIKGGPGTTGASVNETRFFTSNITALRTHQLPNADGILAISVNGITPNTAGDIAFPSINLGSSDLSTPPSTDRVFNITTGSSLTFQGQSTISLGGDGADPNINLTSNDGSIIVSAGSGGLDRVQLGTNLVKGLKTQEFQNIDGQIEVLPDGVPTVSISNPSLTVSLETGSTNKFGQIIVTNGTGGVVSGGYAVTLTYSTAYPNYAFATACAGIEDNIDVTYIVKDMSADSFNLKVNSSTSVGAGSTHKWNYITNGI